VSLFKEIKAEKPTAKETKAINELKVVDAFVDAITPTQEKMVT
jgi:hypothetical protein